jgi:hypothetical protein
MAFRRRFAPFIGLMLLSGSAWAQDAGGCAKFKWSIAREQSAFATAGLQAVAPGKPLPRIMDPAVVRLQPVAEVAFVQPPGHKPRDGTFGGVFKLPPIAVAGTYQLTLSDDAWIDMLQGGHEVRSSAVSGVKDCPGIRKSVRFALQTGDASVQISGSPSDSMKVELLPAE